jgi:hypothetical protein
VTVTSVTGLDYLFYQVGDTESITASLSHSLPSGCSITWGGSATISNVSVNGTTVTATATFNTTGTGLTIDAYTTVQSTPASSSSFSVFQSSISISVGEQCDGESDNVDLIITPESVKSSLTDVYFYIDQRSSSYGNPAGSISTIERRDSDLTHWKVGNVRWYSTEQCHCNLTSDYEISVEFVIDGEYYYAPSDYLTASGKLACIDGRGGVIDQNTDHYWSGDIQINTQKVDPNDPNSLWQATINQGTFARDVQGSHWVTCPANSQWLAMTEAEEAFHEGQWEGTTSNIFADLWIAQNVMNGATANQPFIAATEAEALDAARFAFNTAWGNEQDRSDAAVGARKCAIETEAKNNPTHPATYLATMPCMYAECGGCP